MFDFDGQKAIVTGGTRGIGRGISSELLKAGATVIATYNSNEGAADEFYENNNRYGDRLIIRRFDISQIEQVEAFYQYVEDEFGGFEILVNNSGIRKDAVCGMMSQKEWLDVIDVNLNGVFYMCKYAVKALIRRRYGRIINIISPSARIGFVGQTNYSASKAGLIGFSKSLSLEVATRGITVNCVSPGFIETEFLNDLSMKLKEEYKKQIPQKRFGKVLEVASAILFLASKEASYITGSVLEVTGGL